MEGKLKDLMVALTSVTYISEYGVLFKKETPSAADLHSG